MVYLIIFVILIFLSYRYDYRRETEGRVAWMVIMMTAMILVAGLRYRVGYDTLNYTKYFESQNPLSMLRADDFESSRFAPGYVVLTSIVKEFSDQFVWVQLIHSIFVTSVIFWFLNRNCKNLFFALLLFFVSEYTLLLFEQIRESIAVAIFLLAWPSFRDGKWWKWYLLSCCAAMFHISSFVMFLLPLLTLPGIRELFVFGTRTWIICLVILVAGIAVQALFFRYIQLIALTESMMERAEAYSKSELGTGIFNFGGMVSLLFRNILYPLLALFFLNARKKLSTVSIDKGMKKEEMMTLMSVYISTLTICVAIVGRFNNYFFFFAIISVADWVFTQIPFMGKILRLKFVHWMVLLLPMIGFQLYSGYYANVNESGSLKTYMVYSPYSSYFDQIRDPKREACFKYRRTFGR